MRLLCLACLTSLTFRRLAISCIEYLTQNCMYNLTVLNSWINFRVLYKFALGEETYSQRRGVNVERVGVAAALEGLARGGEGQSGEGRILVKAVSFLLARLQSHQQMV